MIMDTYRSAKDLTKALQSGREALVNIPTIPDSRQPGFAAR